MMRTIMVAAIVAAAPIAAGPAVAQDYTGNVNPGTWASSMPMEASIRAQARRNGGSARMSDAQASANARQHCISSLPKLRSQYGAGDGRVQQMTSLCRKRGYID